MAEDRKFKFEGGRFINRVSGEPIPDDEPVIIFRARDRHATAVLRFYQALVADEHHRAAIQDRIDEFTAYAGERPERIKEPGVTRHIRLNSEAPTPPPVPAVTREELAGMINRELRSYELHGGNILDAIATYHNDKTVKEALETVGDWSAWLADAILSRLAAGQQGDGHD